MDTRTGLIHNLDGQQQKEAAKLWELFMNGVLTEMPQFMPIDGDKIPMRPKTQQENKRRKRRNKKVRSHKVFCNG